MATNRRELAFGGSYFSQVDGEEADRIGVELLAPGLVVFDIRQPADDAQGPLMHS